MAILRNMSRHSITEARNSLSKLVSRARKGEEIELSVRGEPVAKIVSAKPVSARLNFEHLLNQQVILDTKDLDWTKMIRHMRDDGY